MSLMNIMDTGSLSLLAHRTAIGVIGDNIANVNTPGYSRQTALLETATVSPDQHAPVGSGVRVAAVQRAHDRFLQSQASTETSANGTLTTRQTALQMVEPLFSDLAADGLGKAMGEFFNSWQDLAMNPQGTAQRQSVLAKSQTLLDRFHQVGSSLIEMKREADRSLTALTGEINELTGQLVALNGQIKTTEQIGGNTNQMRDQRDQVLENLSRKVGINFLEQTDGTVSVSLSGGPQLVVGDRAATLSLRPDPANSNFSGIMLSQLSGGPGTDITASIARAGGDSGELGGTLQVRDTLVDGYLSALDELATTLANQVNALHATGFGTSGSSGVNFFTPPPAPVPPASFAPGYSVTLGLNLSNADSIAAAATDPTLAGSGSGNNLNALAIAGLKNRTIAMTGGSSTLPEFYNALAGKVGLDVQTTEQGVAQSSAMLKQLGNLRESVAGVSLDEELTNLIKYQKAFEGSARLISTGMEMLDTILNMVR